jgi:hypothetical protein
MLTMRQTILSWALLYPPSIVLSAYLLNLQRGSMAVRDIIADRAAALSYRESKRHKMQRDWSSPHGERPKPEMSLPLERECRAIKIGAGLRLNEVQ